MNATVYADILFLINFIINIILLKITSLFMKAKPSALRLALSSTVGSMYAVFMFFPKISFLYIFPFKLAVSVIMIKIIFPKAKAVKITKSTAIFYLVSFTFAGILLSLIYFGSISKNFSPKVHNGIFYFDISLTKLLLASAICYLVLSFGGTIYKRNKIMGIRRLSIALSGRICEMAALSDTGNLLKDPISKAPVIVAEKRYILNLFPDGIPDIENLNAGNIRLRLIPFSSLGNRDGMLTGFVPDEVCIDGRKTQNVIVAISPHALSDCDEYNALFNPNILS